MAYVIGTPCIGVKDTACVDACPTDAIHSIEGAPQYYIEPSTCIDCDACRTACPVVAIYPGDQVPDAEKKFIAINADFFKGFDKAKSTSYTRQKKDEGAKTEGPAGEAQGKEQESVEWKEVPGWEPLWEAHQDDDENRLERDKRYGRVRTIYESDDRYVIRFFTPTQTPNHPYRYKFGLPEKMSNYTLTAELKKGTAYITGKVASGLIAKLCGHANSFPSQFYAEITLPKPIASVSVQPQGDHIVDVVAIKAVSEAKAA